jgi:hypothetical protein
MMLRLLAVFLLLAALQPAAAAVQSCADLTKLYPGAPCGLDLSRFRFHDPLLDKVESGDTAALFDGTLYTVHSAADVAKLNRKLKPGDQVVFGPGDWSAADIVLHADGTPDHPIDISAAPGVVFTGTALADFSGSNLVVRNLVFRKGAVTRDNFVVFRLGEGGGHTCDRCIADRIVIDGYNAAPANDVKIFYLVLDGRDITVANSTFANKITAGTMLSPGLPSGSCTPGTCFQRLLFVNNTVSNFAAGRAGDDGNHKFMQLGWSGVSTQSAYSVLMGNTFEGDVGENETVSLKASDIVVRGNTFRANRGVLNLRSTNRVLVEDNTFDGTGVTSMGGVRIEGRGHWIVHNLFRHLVQPANNFYWPVSLLDASDENLRDGASDYARVQDIVIAGNRFEGDESPPILVGTFPDPARARTLLPRNVLVLDNTFSGPAHIGFIGDRTQYQGIVERGSR